MAIDLHNLGKTYSGTGTVLHDINLSLPKGSFTSIIGPSGCGKSTLLRILAGIETPDTGQLDMTEGDETSFVFQDARLLPWRTTFANVRLPLELRGRKDSEESVMKAIELVNLTRFKENFPETLSGGMKMRVSLARALVTQPDVMLMDEPFGALDEMTREHLNLELLDIWNKEGWTAVFVTHNIFEAVFLSQKVVVMGCAPGVIHDVIDIDLPWPRSDDMRASREFGEYVGTLQEKLKAGNDTD